MDNEDLKNRIKFKIAMLEIDKEEKPKSINKKAIAAACAILILSTGGVFAKDIENYFKSLFTNSTEAIDTAVENGYVQKEEMDFVYDKDIGVKVDNLVIDDLNLAISFSFESEIENLKSIRFKEFNIINENGRYVFCSEPRYAETLEELPLYNSVNWRNIPEKISDTTFTDSILFGLREHEEFKELLFNIKSMGVTYMDDTYEVVEGNWNFNIEISEEMRKSSKVQYKLLENNEYVESATATLSPTGMYVELNLKQVIDIRKPFDILANKGTIDEGEIYMFSLKYNDRTFWPENWDGGTLKDDNGKINTTVKYNDVGIFSEKVDNFEIYIVQFDTTVKFEKEN